MKSLGIQTDYAIVGGGLSGMLLAHKLAFSSALRDKHILVIEPNDEYWPKIISFWAKPSDFSGLPCSNTIVSSWDAMQMITTRGNRRAKLHAYRFYAFNAKDYTSALRQSLKAMGNVTFLNAAAQQVDRHTVVAADNRITAAYVFDSSPLRRSTDMLYMHVLTETYTTPISGPTTMTFFDTTIHLPGYPSFTYVLPWDEHRVTLQMAAVSNQAQNLESHMRYATQNHYPADKLTLRQYGIIPLATRYNRSGDSPIPIGTNAGLVKAMTGYGFMRFARQADDIVKHLATGHSPKISVLKPRLLGIADRPIMQALIRRPSRLDGLFDAAARYATADQLLGWLDESVTAGNAWAMSRAFSAMVLAPKKRLAGVSQDRIL